MKGFNFGLLVTGAIAQIRRLLQGNPLACPVCGMVAEFLETNATGRQWLSCHGCELALVVIIRPDQLVQEKEAYADAVEVGLEGVLVKQFPWKDTTKVLVWLYPFYATDGRFDRRRREIRESQTQHIGRDPRSLW